MQIIDILYFNFKIQQKAVSFYNVFKIIKIGICFYIDSKNKSKS